MPKLTLPQLRPNQLAILFGVIGIVVVLIFVFVFFRKPSTNTGTPIALTAWGTEPYETMQPAFTAYQAIRPNVTITYKEKEPDGYQGLVLDALAAGEGPDLFTIPSTDVGSMKSKLAPAPSTVTPAFVQANFPKAVESDVIDTGLVYGLPLSLDTLVLLYNRDLLDGAGMVAPPATWDEVVASVPRLAAIDDQNQVQRAAIALGGSRASIPEAGDILSLLMLQNGAPLSNVAHNVVTLGSAGEAALRFYAQFANPASSAYSWNDELGDSYRQLADGKVAMIVAYPSALASVRALNPFADIRMTTVPQAAGGTPRSYGTYPLLVVSKQSVQSGAAWDAVSTLTSNKAAMAAFALASGRAAALTSVISDQIAADATKIQGTQALQARSWFQWDGEAVREEFDRSISEVTSGVSTVTRATQALETRLRALIR